MNRRRGPVTNTFRSKTTTTAEIESMSYKALIFEFGDEKGKEAAFGLLLVAVGDDQVYVP